MRGVPRGWWLGGSCGFVLQLRYVDPKVDVFLVQIATSADTVPERFEPYLPKHEADLYPNVAGLDCSSWGGIGKLGLGFPSHDFELGCSHPFAIFAPNAH
jgi:hypothetical protein